MRPLGALDPIKGSHIDRPSMHCHTPHSRKDIEVTRRKYTAPAMRTDEDRHVGNESVSGCISVGPAAPETRQRLLPGGVQRNNSERRASEKRNDGRRLFPASLLPALQD